MRYLAALREGHYLLWFSEDGFWLPKAAFKANHHIQPEAARCIRRFGNPASAIEVADEFARRLGCGWRVEMVP